MAMTRRREERSAALQARVGLDLGRGRLLVVKTASFLWRSDNDGQVGDWRREHKRDAAADRLNPHRR